MIAILTGHFLDHRHLDVPAVPVSEGGDCGIDCILARGSDFLDGILALEREGNHDLVGKPAFGHFAEPVGGRHLVTCLGYGREVPELLVVEGVGVFASFEEYSLHRGEVVLESVVDARQKARAERGLEHLSQEFHLVAVLQPSGALEHLHRRPVSVHLDDLCEELRASEVYHAEFVFGDRSVQRHGHEVGHYACYLSCSIHIMFCFLLS